MKEIVKYQPETAEDCLNMRCKNCIYNIVEDCYLTFPKEK